MTNDSRLQIIDPCVYIVNDMIVLKYVSKCIIVIPSMIDIDVSVDSIKNGCKNFVLTNEVYIHKLLGVKITQLDEKRFRISRPFMIDIIIFFSTLTQTTMVWTPTISQIRLASPSHAKIYPAIRANNNETTEHHSVC